MKNIFSQKTTTAKTGEETPDTGKGIKLQQIYESDFVVNLLLEEQDEEKTIGDVNAVREVFRKVATVAQDEEKAFTAIKIQVMMGFKAINLQLNENIIDNFIRAFIEEARTEKQ